MHGEVPEDEEGSLGRSSQRPRKSGNDRIVFRFPGSAMGILDEAIREHLELKRQHGADDSELKQLEDEAFGPPERPGDEASQADPLAEAPTQFMSQPDAAEAGEEPTGASPREEAAARIAGLQEPPPAPEEAGTERVTAEEAPAAAEATPEEQAGEEPPAVEEQPAAEQEAVDEPAPSGPSTEERQAIAEQPTELYEIEEELGEVAPQGPPADDGAEEEDDDFWDEQRLSDELDQALEAPLLSDEELESDEPEPAEDEPEEEEPPPAAAESGDTATESGDATESSEEDVLEETPDFLEQSPEDDELWFEQKPPKDFDFDD
jgi:hypothetical protein